MSLAVLLEPEYQPLNHRCVVRVTTSYWHDKRGLHLKRSLTFLRRQCEGFNILEEDAGGMGVDEVVSRIVNLNQCEDGVYEVIPCNHSTDWETGHVDDYDYKLVPCT